MGYTDYDKQLGTKYLTHIKAQMALGGKQAVPDATVDEARDYFTRMFGVRIYDVNDLLALETGTAAYLVRSTNVGQPQVAVERAVSLKQTYFPESLRFWNTADFSKFPYVADIPNPVPGLPVLSTLAGAQPSQTLADIVNKDTQAAANPNSATTPATNGTISSASVADDRSWIAKYWYIPVGGLLLIGIAVVIVKK